MSKINRQLISRLRGKACRFVRRLIPAQVVRMMKYRNTYSFLALLLVLLGIEVPVLVGVRLQQWSLCLTIIVGVALLLIALLWMHGRRRGMKFRFRSEILTKLLANAISPRWLGVFYLVAFVIHVGWLTDSIMYLYLEKRLAVVVISIIVCLVGMVVIIIFFPDGRKVKSDSPVRVFISGISLPFLPSDMSRFNLRPLVRVLQEETDGRCEMLILMSDFAPKTHPEVIAGINQILTGYCGLQALGPDVPLTRALDKVIREAAKREFPDKRWIDTMPIHFTEPCNYNAFSQCYATLSPWVKRMDSEDRLLAFNMSPGTGIIGSLMTLMAIHADRSLYYYSQDDSLPDEQRLTPVDKSSVPLYSLLSQALENIEKDN